MPNLSDKYKVYDCFERQTVDLPLATVLNSSGTLNILPEVKARGYFDIDYRGDKLTFVAGRYVGLIPINDNICINVKPKIEISDLVRVIAIAGGELGVLRFFTRGYEKEGRPETAIIIVVLRTLLEQLHEVATEGLLKEYRRAAGEGFLRSRINFNRTLQRHWSRGKFASASWDSFSFSKDNDPNRLVKYTLWYCGTLLESFVVPADIRRELAEVYDLFDAIPLDPTKALVARVRSLVQRQAIPRLRHYYDGVCETCLFIAGNDSISLKVRGSDVDLLSFVLNLEDMFERYVRNILRGSLEGTSNEVRVIDGNKEGRSYLFIDSRTMEVKPDIVVRKGLKSSLIADVKYKLKVNESDRYQLIAHTYSCGVRRALFVLPSFGDGTDGLVRCGQVRDSTGIEIYEYRMRLDGDIEKQERLLSQSVETLMAGSTAAT
jgi:5-methylcytosine-specific restriction enzyme subunit McrC